MSYVNVKQSLYRKTSHVSALPELFSFVTYSLCKRRNDVIWGQCWHQQFYLLAVCWLLCFLMFCNI
jgi:hypothetical protein